MNIQFFAAGKKDNVKALQETRAEKLEELKTLYATLEAEQRAVTEEEEKRIEEIRAEVEKIDKTIKILDEMKKSFKSKEERAEEGKNEERAQEEEKAFEAYLRATVEERADSNITKGENGVIIPTTIAKRIIKKIYDISPILERSTKYTIKGNLVIPYYSAENDDVMMVYQDEFVELESKSDKFTSITLKGFLAGVLTKVSKSLMNNTSFDLVGFVVDHIAYDAHRFIERELLIGTTDKIEGLSGVKLTVTAESATAIKADELIDLQGKVKDGFQKDAIWIMSTKTRTSLRKLKDGNNRYLLQDDITAPFGYTLLGKPVYTSDNMPEMETGKRAVLYGDMSGLAVKFNEELEIQVLREKYATQHAVGIVGWLEMDAKVEHAQKIAALNMA